MSEPEHQPSIAELKAELVKRKAEHERLEAEKEAAIEQMKADEAEITKAAEVLRQARIKRDETDTKRRVARTEAINEYNKIGALERLIAQEEANKYADERARERRQLLDELTATAPWRDRILPHQLDGAHYLSAAQRAICADGMGLGKTLQVGVVTLDMLQAMNDGGKKVLVIALAEVASVFMKEISTWAPERALVKLFDLGGLKQTIETFNFYKDLMPNERTDIVNYELIRRASSKDFVDALILEQYDTVICDEAHVLKQTSSSGFKVVKKIIQAHNTCPTCKRVMVTTSPTFDRTEWWQGICMVHGQGPMERSVKNFFPLTGTPVLNRPTELFPLLHLVNEEAFPKESKFKDDFCVRGWDNKVKWRAGGEARLVNQIKGSYLRRTRDDAGIILPKQTITIHDIEFDEVKYPKQTKLLKMLKEHSQIEIETGKAADMASLLALITRQRQAAVWPGGIWMNLPDPTNPWTAPPVRTHVGALYQESAKLDRAVELADEFAEAGERYVLFSQFREAIDEFGRRRGEACAVFHGGTSTAEATLIKDNFDRSMGQEAKWEGVAAHYQKGGVGLTLTAATQVIILDEQWSPGMNQQAYDRVNRLGQTEETGVHVLHLKNTVDSWLYGLIEEKRKIVDGFEVELSFQQLADVFMSMDM